MARGSITRHGSKPTVPYYPSTPLHEQVKFLRVTAHQFLNDRASLADLQARCLETLEEIKKANAPL